MAKKILLVEDDKSLRDALHKKIQSENYELIEATNGNEALAQFTKESPDLILLDLVMPEKSGFEVLEEIRIKHNSKVKVIILSNLDSVDDRELAKNLGISNYIEKSNISLTDLMVKVKKALSA